jgi:hypothetical protein
MREPKLNNVPDDFMSLLDKHFHDQPDPDYVETIRDRTVIVVRVHPYAHWLYKFIDMPCSVDFEVNERGREKVYVSVVRGEEDLDPGGHGAEPVAILQSGQLGQNFFLRCVGVEVDGLTVQQVAL